MPEVKGDTRSAVYFSIFISCRSYGCRFLAQEHIGDASKIPTVIYYDRSGKVRAVDAEAMKESVYVLAEDEN